jgi:hypothetical protein
MNAKAILTIVIASYVDPVPSGERDGSQVERGNPTDRY